MSGEPLGGEAEAVEVCLACTHPLTDHDPHMGLCGVDGCRCGGAPELGSDDDWEDDVTPLDFTHE